MLEEIQQNPMELATQALEKYNTERSLRPIEHCDEEDLL